MINNVALVAWLSAALASAQSLSALRGTVRDSSDAVVPGATVVLSNAGMGFSRETRSGADGDFAINGIPQNSYLLVVTVAGFQAYNAPVSIRPGIPLDVSIRLELASQRGSVTVQATADNLVENVVDRRLLAVLPMASPGSGLNDAIIFTTPGVAADSNGFFHPLGDHAQVSYVIDGQPVSDQRNKVFSTSIPANAIQSMEVISGSPPAEYGDKTSLVINAATRSGLGQKAAGKLRRQAMVPSARIGEEATLGLGGARWGNFLAVNAERSGRFLDTPEFWPMHDIGNSGNVLRSHRFQARRKGCPASESDGRAQLDADSEHLRSAAPGPAAKGGVVQYRARAISTRSMRRLWSASTRLRAAIRSITIPAAIRWTIRRQPWRRTVRSRISGCMRICRICRGGTTGRLG